MAAVPKIRIFGSRRIELSDLVRWTHMFYALFAAGLPIVTCLQTLQQSGHLHNRRLLELTNTLLNAVANGERLSQSMQSPPLPAMFVYMIKIAEETGEIEHCLRLLGHRYHQQLVWQRQLRKLLTYPLFVLLLTFAVMAFVALFVFPQFQSMYQMMGLKLSDSTVYAFLLLRFSFPFLCIFFLSFVLIMGCVYHRLAQDREQMMNVFSKLCKQPLIGTYPKLWFSKSFAGPFSLLLQAGLPLSTSLQVLSESAQHPLLRFVSTAGHQTILQGNPFSAVIEVFPFSTELQAMIQLAEQTGDLAGSLTRAADFLQHEWQDMVALLIERLQPLLMIVVGCLVGMTVLLVMLPLFQLMTAV